MTFTEAAVFHDISPTTIQKWKKRIHSKTTRDIKSYKIKDEALDQDIKDYPDDYHYKRAQRFRCRPTGISKALKRIGISKKKTLEHHKACPVKRVTYQTKLSHCIAQGFAIVYMDESETMRTYGYHPLIALALIVVTGKPKIEPTSLVRSMEKCCLHSIA